MSSDDQVFQLDLGGIDNLGAPLITEGVQFRQFLPDQLQISLAKMTSSLRWF
jgi:hypothetical protein